MGKLLEKALKKPLLQVALDFTDLEEALRVTDKVVKAGAHIIEAGTPLIKSCGVAAVRELRKKANSEVVIVADLKAVDAVELEFKVYAENGANAVTLLGFIDDDVVSEAVEVCKRLGVDLVVDLIYTTNPVNRALRLADLGAKILALHIGVDVQRRRGLTAKQLLREVQEVAASGLTVAVAGGIKPHEVDMYVAHGARIIIIGGAITRSDDPFKLTVEALKRMGSYG